MAVPGSATTALDSVYRLVIYRNRKEPDEVLNLSDLFVQTYVPNRMFNSLNKTNAKIVYDKIHRLRTGGVEARKFHRFKFRVMREWNIARGEYPRNVFVTAFSPSYYGDPVNSKPIIHFSVHLTYTDL